MPRAGYLTASSFDALMTGAIKTPDKFNDTALAVVNRLAADMMGYNFVDPMEEHPPWSIKWGKMHENKARTYYQYLTGTVVHLADFCAAEDNAKVGGTMDGLIGFDGGLEIKCPWNTARHVNAERHLSRYIYQIQGYIWIYDLEWVDFVSFDPRLSDPYKLRITRVDRDDDKIAALTTRCQLACDKAIKIVDDFGGISKAEYINRVYNIDGSLNHV